MTPPRPRTDPPLTVGLVVPSFDKGGLEQVVLNLYRGYRARGCRAVVLVEGVRGGAMLARLDRPEHAVVLDREEGLFLETLAAWEIDVLHYHYASFGLREAKALGLHTLYTLHNAYTWLPEGGFAHHAARVLAADRVVAVSEFVRSYFARRAGCPVDRIDVIPNGVDLAWAARRAPLPDLGLPAGAFVFVLPASTHPVKHHALAIRAFESVARRHAEARLALVGNEGEEACAAFVAERVAASPVADRIHRIDYVPHDAMPSLYADLADCVLLPSLQEGCANVVLEALALDRPMILTDVGAAREARRLSPRVRVVPATEAVERLTPERIAELSRTGETGNLRALTDAMESALAARGGAATPEELAARRRRIGLDRMADAYHRMFRVSAPLSPPPAGATPWEVEPSPEKACDTPS